MKPATGRFRSVQPRPVALAFGALSLLGGAAPYTGEALGLFVQVAPIVEVVDHVVPSAVILIACGSVLVTGSFPLAAMLVIALAGLWMTATHLPLLVQASEGSVDWPAALWHSTPGLIILAAALLGSAILWREPEQPEPR